MPLVSDLMTYMARLGLELISSLGYLGVFLLMTMESMFIPVPSELVMPFAGFLVSSGKFSMLYVFIASSLGSIAGSSISYYIGKMGGNAAILKYGKYLLLEREDLKKAEKWFKRNGDSTVFIARFIPVVRHLISIPAGVGRMNFKRFIVLTFIGASLWNMFLAYIGYFLGENWQAVRHYTEPLSKVMAVLIVIGCIWFIYHHFWHRIRERIGKRKK